MSLLVLIVMTPAVAVAENAPLEGFGDVKLGQPIAQLKQQRQVTERTEESIKVYTDAAKASINGMDFDIIYWTPTDVVENIQLYVATKAKLEDCADRRAGLRSILVQKYGPFDDGEDFYKGGTVKGLLEKDWTDRRLELSMYWEKPMSCEIWMNYILKFATSPDSNKL